MPRQARIDTPGAVHHIIVRGIEHRKIFIDDQDCEAFTDRLGRILTETDTGCFAWALIPNHFHLLLRTASAPISTVMRRLLTGHAMVMGTFQHKWHDDRRVLREFSKKNAVACKHYRAFVSKGIQGGKREDLTGGGLIRSAGGWLAVKALRFADSHQKSDERILATVNLWNEFCRKTRNP